MLSHLTILVVEDHELARACLIELLEIKKCFKKIFEAANGEEALQIALDYEPDIILMDINMPMMNGIEATQEIKQQLPDVKILMLTSLENKEDVFASLSAGANAYVNKAVDTERLMQIIEMVSEGAVWLDPSIADFILVNHTDKAISSSSVVQDDYNLTRRELEVLHCIVDGLANNEIAEKLCVSTNTVKTHIVHLLEKLSVEHRTQAAVKALQTGLVTNR